MSNCKNQKELEMEWYRRKVIPYYTEIAEISITKDNINRKRKKGGTDVPKNLQ